MCHNSYMAVDFGNDLDVIVVSAPTEVSVVEVNTSSDPELMVVGIPGTPGPRGDTGPSNILNIGTVTTGLPGTNASATIAGTSPAQTLSLTIPRGDKGDKGDAGTLFVGEVATSAPGSNAIVTNTGTSSTAVLNFAIPRGTQGPQGIAGQPVSLLAADQLRGDAPPGLMVREGSFKNLIPNPRGVTPDNTVREQRRNYAYNTGSVDVTGFHPGGQNNNHYVIENGSLKSISNAAGEFATCLMDVIPSDQVMPNTTYTFSAWVYIPSGNPSVHPRVFGNPVIADINGSAVTERNMWVRSSLTFTTGPTVGGSAIGVAFVGVATDADQVFYSKDWMLERADYVQPFFDGNTPDSSTINYAWLGTPNASASVATSAYVEARRNLALRHLFFLLNGPGSTTNDYVAPDGKIWSRFSGLSTSGQSDVARLDTPLEWLIPDATYAVSFLVHNANTFPVTISCDWGDTLDGFINQVVSPGATVRLSGFVSRSTYDEVFRFLDVTFGGGGEVWITDVLIERSPVIGDYFDGNTPAAAPYVYEWTGTPSASMSVQRARKPAGWSNFNGSIHQIENGVRGETANYGGPRILAPVEIGKPYNFMAVLRTTRANQRFFLFNLGGLGLTSPVSDAGLPAGSIVTLRVYDAASPVSGIIDFVVCGSDMGSIGPVDVLGAVVTNDIYDGPTFDGSNGPATWDDPAQPHNSSSTLNANSVSYWDGTAERWVQAETAGVSKNYVDGIGTPDAFSTGTVVRRDASGGFGSNSIDLVAPPTEVQHATRKDYVDNIGSSAPITGPGVVRRNASGYIEVQGIDLMSSVITQPHHATRKDYVDGRIDAQQITDWNAALVSGTYYSSDPASLNTPENGKLYLGQVEGIGGPADNPLWITQTVHEFNSDSATDTKTWRRSSGDSGGGVRTWSAWYRLRISEVEQNATLGTAAYAPNSIMRRDVNGYTEVGSMALGTPLSSDSLPNTAVRKDYVDGIGTSSNVPDTIVRRNGNGGVDFSQVWASGAQPVESHSLTRKDYVDNIGTSDSQPDTVARRASDGSAAFSVLYIDDQVVIGDPVPTETFHATRKDYVDTQVGTRAAGTHTHAATDISNSTATGRSVLTAADAAAARTAIGAGTSSLVIGTTSTTAKAGDYAPPDATTGAKGLVQLANHLGGTATAPTVRSASEIQTGIVELATAAETTTGTDNTRAVHPQGLKVELDKKANTTDVAASPIINRHNGTTVAVRPNTARPVWWIIPSTYTLATNGTTAGGTIAAVNGLDIVSRY